jgi:hypothetical protein
LSQIFLDISLQISFIALVIKSVPMIIISAYSPLTSFTLSIHFPKFWNEVTSKSQSRYWSNQTQ